MKENLYYKIVAILDKVQVNTSSTQKFQVLLSNLYKNSGVQEFYKWFEKILSILLNKDPKLKNVHVDRVIDFCMLFCALNEGKSNEESFLFKHVFNFLLKYHNVKSDVVRFRVCQCIHKLFINLTEQEVSEDLCSKIEEAMLERLQIDNKSEIRYEAVCAVYRLQDALNVHCKIIPKLICHMNSDQSWKVRKVCVEKIHVKRDVMIALVLRTRDVHSNVRLAAFKRLSHLAKALKISERHSVIINGFFDSCPDNVHYVKNNLIRSWLMQYDDDYLEFLHSLRLDLTEKEIAESTRVISFVLQAIFKNRPWQEAIDNLSIDKNRLIPVEHLNWEIAIYWRFLIDTLRKSDNYESLLDTILPELINFTTFIRDFVTTRKQSQEFQFVLNELFIITQSFDVSDTVRRDVLTKVVLETLKDVELLPVVLVTVIDNLKRTISNLEKIIDVIIEFVSDLLYSNPRKEEKSINDMHVAELKLSFYELKEKLKKAVVEEDYDSAAAIQIQIDQTKAKVDDLQNTVAEDTDQIVLNKTDSSAVLKSLNVIRALLLFPEITSLNPVLRTMNDNVVMEFIADDDLLIRDKALECFGLCCVIDKKCAERGILIFTSCIFANESTPFKNTTSVLIAIKSVCDLFILYGPDLLQSLEENELLTISPSQVIQSLVYLMDDENVELKECAVVGLCNLIVHGGIQSAALISRMILKWCNPILDGDSERIRQHIGLMLEKLPALPGAAELLENAILPTLKTIINAPKSSPLSDVNFPSLTKFMISLCSLCEVNDNLHYRVAFKICMEINDHKDETVNIILAKTLLLLDIPLNRQLIQGLIKVCDDILEEEENRIILKNMEKFKTNLVTTLANHIELAIPEDIEVEE